MSSCWSWAIARQYPRCLWLISSLTQSVHCAMLFSVQSSTAVSSSPTDTPRAPDNAEFWQIYAHNATVTCEIKSLKSQTACADFPNVVAAGSCYAHAVSYKMPHCWGCAPRLGAITPKLELGRDLCTMRLTAKFHHHMFTRSEVIVLTNKQTNKQTDKQTDATESIKCSSLRYAVG